MAMYKTLIAVKTKMMSSISLAVFRSKGFVLSIAASITTEKGINKIIQIKSTYLISNIVKKANIQIANVITDERSSIDRLSSIITFLRTSSKSNVGKRAKNKGDMVPRLCELFENVTVNGYKMRNSHRNFGSNAHCQIEELSF